MTILGLQMGALMSGAVVTEQIFVVPGFGRLIVEAVFTRDYPLVQGVVLITASAYVLINLLVDVSYSLLNPRIRIGGGRVSPDAAAARAPRRLPARRRSPAPRPRPRRVAGGGSPGARRRWRARSWCCLRGPGGRRAVDRARRPDRRPTGARSARRRPGRTRSAPTTSGRDILSRVVWGARVSMQAGVFSILLAIGVGVPPAWSPATTAAPSTRRSCG